jgi:uncharacterized protein
VRKVNEKRVSEPAPSNRVSVLFVISMVLMLGVIGASAWIYLDYNIKARPKIISATATIDATVIVAEPKITTQREPVIPFEEKPVVDRIEDPKDVPKVAASKNNSRRQRPSGDLTATNSIDKDANTKSAEDVKKTPETNVVIEPEQIAETNLPAKPMSDLVEGDLARLTETQILPANSSTKISSVFPTKEILDYLNIEPSAGAFELPTRKFPDGGSAVPMDKSETVTVTTKTIEPNFPAAKKLPLPINTDPKTVMENEGKEARKKDNDTVVEEILIGSGSDIADLSPEQENLIKQQDFRITTTFDSTPALPTKNAIEPAPVLPPTLPSILPTKKAPVSEISGDQQDLNIITTFNSSPELPSKSAIEPALVLPPTPLSILATNDAKEINILLSDKASSREPIAYVNSKTSKPRWQANAQPFVDPQNRPRIAIIISEMGISKVRTAAAINQLPPSVTLAFNPYGQDLQSWIDQSREKGHEILLQLPMEPVGYPKIDPGPKALLTNLAPEENLLRLNWSLNRFTGYTGLTNQMGSKFTASRPHIEKVLEVIKDKELLYVDSRTASNSVAASVARELSVPVAVNNRFLDHRADAIIIDARLAELEKIALQRGAAIGVGYPHPSTMERLKLWTETLPDKGIVLAPVSALVDKQEIR